MSNINETMKLKDILFKVPGSAGIFREIDVDFVNHGEKTLKEAHEEGNFNLENIIYEVNQLGKERIEGIDVSYMDQTSIIKYIERKYYEDLLDELPVLNDYVEKLGKKYKKEEAEYDKAAELFYNIYREMTVHIETEQSDVYPLLLTYYEEDSDVAYEALKPHITRLFDEHKNIVNWFKQIADKRLHTGRQQRTIKRLCNEETGRKRRQDNDTPASGEQLTVYSVQVK